MLLTLLVFALVWLGLTLALTAALWAGTLFLQGFLYTEPASGLYWRSPAAAAGLALFLTLWCYLAYVRPEEGTTASGRVGPQYDTLFRFSPRQMKEFTEFWVVRGEDTPANRTHFKLGRNDQGRTLYLDQQRKQPPGHSDEIIVMEDGQEVHFRAERATSGPNKDKIFVAQGQSLRYLDDRGRVMTDDSPGRVYTLRWVRLLVSVGLNLSHLALWFVALWLLLRFQWSHALGLAAVLWLVITLGVLPMMLDHAADRGTEKASQRPAVSGRQRGDRHDMVWW